jgi:hemerythrin
MSQPCLINHDLFIVWKPEYELKIPIVDEQHRGIVSTINSLFYGMQNSHGEHLLRPIIGMVKEYTAIHFQTEEEFLRQHNYPKLKAHQALHNELTQELDIVGSKSLWDKNPYEFLEFLKEWWHNHICKKDYEFQEYLLLK